MRGLSLDEVAAATRIPRRSLERLEAGAFDSEPDGFARGFVRTVADAMGLDARPRRSRGSSARWCRRAPGAGGTRRSGSRRSLGLAAAGAALGIARGRDEAAPTARRPGVDERAAIRRDARPELAHPAHEPDVRPALAPRFQLPLLAPAPPDPIVEPLDGRRTLPRRRRRLPPPTPLTRPDDRWCCGPSTSASPTSSSTCSCREAGASPRSRRARSRSTRRFPGVLDLFNH